MSYKAIYAPEVENDLQEGIDWYKDFPYLIHFKVEKENKTVKVIAVFNTSRNPAIWENRKTRL